MFIPILAARYAVQVDDYLKTVGTSPTHSHAQVRELSLDIRFARADLPGPIPDRHPHVVKAAEQNKFVNNVETDRLAVRYIPSSGNSSEVCLCYPCVPMSLEFLLRSISVLQLPKRPLIDNVVVTRTVV